MELVETFTVELVIALRKACYTESVGKALQVGKCHSAKGRIVILKSGKAKSKD